MNISDNAAALAFVLAGAAAGGWASMMTAQQRSMNKRIQRVENCLVVLLEELVGPSAAEVLDAYAVDRNPGRVLDHYTARVQRARGGSTAGH